MGPTHHAWSWSHQKIILERAGLSREPTWEVTDWPADDSVERSKAEPP